MIDNKNFYASIADNKKDIDRVLSRPIRTLMFDIQHGVTSYPGNGGDGTPRDTARAVAGWMVSKHTPSEYVPPEGLTSYSTDAAFESMNHVDFENPFAVFYITNNVPYIVRLNEGHSLQAPEHWIERIVQAAVAKYERT